MLGGGCNKPPNLVCRPAAFYQVLDPNQGAGAARLNIERLGPEVKETRIFRIPTSITLKSNKYGRVFWGGGDFNFWTDLIYSPVEGLARNVDDPSDATPMRRFSDGMSEHVRFVFLATLCRNGGERRWGMCELDEHQVFMVADMNCERD